MPKSLHPPTRGEKIVDVVLAWLVTALTLFGISFGLYFLWVKYTS